MRHGTAICLAGLAAGLVGLVASIRHASSPPPPDQKPEFVFLAWGAAEETKELRKLVIEPINDRGADFRIRLVSVPSDYHTKLCTMIAGGTPPDFFYLNQEYVRSR